ncbi:hypothetical protein GE061_016118 [Apolygus lucorum]|uniref:serine--tRNA ligase n=1 Tax=Apolygus lucorum TaxID=248454 RepID=A0A8S9XHB0_APOLU|nr:hypothetical protein GE061_016118 [Apolygus lucorum]
MTFVFGSVIRRKISPTGLRLCRHSSKFDRLNWKYLSDPQNTSDIKENISRRKGVGNIDEVLHLKSKYDCANADEKDVIRKRLLREALRIPNVSHSSLNQNEGSPVEVKKSGTRKKYDFRPASFEILSKRWSLTRTDSSVYTGPRSYYLLDQLADLEAALVDYAVDLLQSRGFRLVSVPDVLPREIIEDCGMDTRGVRSQVYTLGGDLADQDLCLSGTAEMGISFLLKDQKFQSEDLPRRIAAVSRCYRAETSKISEEKGIYRVHQFTKVEMYGVYLPEDSAQGLLDFRDIQEEFFNSLGLELQILDMPECELGAQAQRKFDIEAYFPGKDMWGELSSASDCTDYQSRRLNITYDSGRFAHTINGTACAIPRTIVAIMETHQCKDGTVLVPKCLVPYLGYDVIANSRLPKITPFKIKRKPVKSNTQNSYSEEQLSGSHK